MPKSKKHPKAERAEQSEHSNGARHHAARGRPMWSGSISFGLVNIPIKIYPGIRTKDVRFHLLHEKDKARLQEKLYCPVDQEEVPRPEVIKGFEVAKGQHIVVTPEEFASLAPKASRTIELMNVVDMSEIDPMFFDRPYYLVPDERAAKAYLLLGEALRQQKKGAIVKFVMRNKEYVGAVRPIKNVLCLDTLHFADEIISVKDLGWEAPDVHLRDAEVKMATQLLDSLASEFHPEELHDDYREAMLKLIEKKAAGEEIAVQPEPEEKEPQVIDLMEALKKSVAEVQRQKRKVA